ncbi:MAG: hypothetical protein Kow0013_18460 [Pararhodobacter sp.]
MAMRGLACATATGVALMLAPGFVGPVRADDSCRWANDGECDDPTVPGAVTGVCAPGTDSTDCANVRAGSAGPNSCRFANDGECDDPTVPGHVTAACAPGTDQNDCRGQGVSGGGGPNVLGGGGGAGGALSTYSPWRRITNDQRQYATQPGGVLALHVYNGMTFQAGTYTIHHGYTDGSGPHSPIWNIRSETVTLSPNTQYVARADRFGDVSFMPRDMPMYPRPAPGTAMIYARNDDPTSWRAICVVPQGWGIGNCGP